MSIASILVEAVDSRSELPPSFYFLVVFQFRRQTPN